jgi:hypothetical protein
LPTEECAARISMIRTSRYAKAQSVLLPLFDCERPWMPLHASGFKAKLVLALYRKEC